MADRVSALRSFALSLPETVEDFPWGDRVAKVRGKVFVFLGRQAITVKLAESHEHAMSLPGAEPTGYGLGRAGWVNVPLRATGTTLDLLRDLVEESYRIVAPKRLVAELDAAVTRAPGAAGRGSGSRSPRAGAAGSRGAGR